MSAVEAPAGRPAAPAKKTMLRRLLSHHEIATLLVLLHAPIGANAKPELPALRKPVSSRWSSSTPKRHPASG